MINKNVLIVDTSNINKWVFKSHVFNLSQKFADFCKVWILSINHNNNIKKLEKINYININSKLDFWWLIKEYKQIFSIKFYKNINNLIREKDIHILYCQNYLPSFLWITFKIFNKNLKVHADIKWIVPEEHLLYNSWFKKYIIYFLAKIMEFFIFKYSDSFSVVSNEFKRYFEKKYNLRWKEIIILPSSLEQKNFYFDENLRNKIRKIEKWEDKKILVYSWSMVEWQLPEKLITTMKDISDNNNEILPLILTLDKDKAEKIKNDLKFEKLIIKSCNWNNEVNEYLNASDIAITIRKDDIVNNVSSPTKIAEYLYTKNKLILSKWIWDYSELSEKYKWIYKIEDIENININEMNNFINNSIFDNDIIDLIDREYTLEANLKKIKKLFTKYN